MAAVELECPICDRWYQFDPDKVSVCQSCEHVVTLLDPHEEAPRIVPDPKRTLTAFLAFVVSVVAFIIGLFTVPLVLGIAGVAGLVGVILIQLQRCRCGNCGYVITRRARCCYKCRAVFGFNVQ